MPGRSLGGATLNFTGGPLPASPPRNYGSSGVRDRGYRRMTPYSRLRTPDSRQPVHAIPPRARLPIT